MTDPDGAAAPRPPRRRWRRALAVLLVAAGLGAGGLVGAEHYARAQVDRTVRTALPGLSADAAITTDGVLLPQLLRRELKTLSIRADDLVLAADRDPDGAAGAGGAGSGRAAGAGLEALELTNVTVSLTGVGTRDPYQAGLVHAEATIGFDELERIIAAASPAAPDLTITPNTLGSATEPGRVTASATVLGADASVVFEPAVTEAGGLELTAVAVSVLGMDIDVDSSGPLESADDSAGADDVGSFSAAAALAFFGLEEPKLEIGPEVLPDGVKLSQVYIGRDGAHLTLSGTDVALADW
ncbi:hypothetical protein SAMN05216355_11725 [Actinomyces ruminicola]|uniref:DUF2993 domain-containing protein n=1 Tax=Actinomyces ruminicola TaxID=332524 RepID=A0A1H0EMD7_9ACTO|nr:hypothetical protein [Actinomyces ruminicola]SDN83617.1 hypothetical protein SAMN05216355_11725 [Actinomyces ruminicola]